MKRSIRFFVIIVVTILTVAIDVSVLPRWGIQPIDLTLTWLLIVAVRGSMLTAAGLAVMAGLLRASVTAWPPLTYGAAYLLALAVTWIIVRRVLAERATVSLLAAAASGSAVFAFFVWAIVSSAHILDPKTLPIDLHQWELNGLLQIVIQPCLVWLIWRWRGGGNFSAIQPSFSQPFA